MGRVRLQICVLPWEQPSSSSSSSAPARQETLKWCEPCAEDTSMQEVCDRILISWGKIFKASMGPLEIRHLKTAYGDFLDLEDRVVGDFFDDRGADGNIRNSILEVHRYPPQLNEFDTLQRFSSLAPNSSARPKKRRLELASHSYPSRESQNVHRAIPSIEEWDADGTVPYGTASKRQRTQESRLNRTFDAQQKMTTRKEQEAGIYHSSQTSGTQESVHQVIDSQKPPDKKHLNFYGTPSSLLLNGLQEPIPNNATEIPAVPDSPLGRETVLGGGAFGGPMQLDRESTKSESPELRLSVDGVPPKDSIGASDQRPIDITNSAESLTVPCTNNSVSQQHQRPVLQNVEKNPENHDLGLRQAQEKAANVNPTSKRRPLTANPAHVQNVRSHSNTLRESDSIFDPIESDTESFNEKQQMQSAKRLRSSKTPIASFKSLSTSNKAGGDHKDGQFLVPSLPQSRMNGARKSLGEVHSSEWHRNIQVPGRDPKDANTSIQNTPERQGEHDAESLEDTQSELCNNDRLETSRETPKSSIVCNDLIGATPNSSQVTTALSQDSDRIADGTAASSVQQQDCMSSQNREPHQTKRLGHDPNDAISKVEESRFAQEAERLADEAEHQQEKNSDRESLEKRTAATEEVANHKIEQKVLADKKAVEEDNARAEESAQAKKANAKKLELAEAKRIEETRTSEARFSAEKMVSEGVARRRQIRETSVAEEANKLMLAADGAKQIEIEKKEKEKARREERAAKKKANEAKAKEQERQSQGEDGDKKFCDKRSAPENVQISKDDTDRLRRARTVQETATALKEQAQKRIADRDVQKRRNSSEVSCRASTNPPTFSNSAGSKRSMTPHVPGSSIIRSSPHLNSLTSSPLGNGSPGNMDAPLRSALRQTPSTLRRSISSVYFDLPPQAKLNEYDPSTVIKKSLMETNQELATKPSSMTNNSKIAPKNVSNAPSKRPLKTPISKKAADGKIKKDLAKNGKVQTMLNVTRQPKKAKGRAINPPVTSKQTPKQETKQEIILSSGGESSTSEEPVWQTGNAKAGPSSRKPIFPASTCQGKKVAELKSSGTSIDPTICNVKVEKDKTVALAARSRSTSKSDSNSLQNSSFTSKSNNTSLQNSTSRSPALALSETISLSSGSASSTDSDSDIESDSEKESQESGKLAPVSTKRVSEVVNMGIKQPAGYFKSTNSSHPSSHASSSRARGTVPTSGDGKHLDQAADKQLQLESRQLIHKYGAKQASPTTNRDVDGKVINQGLDHAGRLPNGIRPVYYKYPGLSELQKLPRAGTVKAESNVDTSSSQPADASVVESSRSDESSSDSDESSNTSDEDQDIDEIPSQTGFRQQSRPYRGMKGLIKVANAVRSKLGSSQQ